MKATNLFKATVVTLTIMASAMTLQAKAQDDFITNEVKNSEQQVVSKTVFRKDGAYLYRHTRYNYTYDDQNRLASEEMAKWDGSKDAWKPYSKRTYEYGKNTLTICYARWNESHKAYDDGIMKSVSELNDENKPLSYKVYKQEKVDTPVKDWVASTNK
ncbi:MAG: DUF3836 domain-containing protein [Bacteroides sp.]|jgi:hypothetical protein|nr:DUF3836 domain-containing protein [Bacteroides sp.]